MGIHCIFPLRQANCPGLQRCSGRQQKSRRGGQTAEDRTQRRDAQVSGVAGMEADADENKLRASDSWGRNTDVVTMPVELSTHPHLLSPLIIQNQLLH